MKNITFLFALLMTTMSFAQKNGELVIFSNLGDPFFVLLNGEKQNYEAQTNVKVQELSPGYYSCKVISSNNLYSFDKNFEIKSGMQTTYRIVEKSGTPKFRYFSEVTINGSEQNTAGQTVVSYHAPGNHNHGTTQTTQTTQTSTTTTVGSTGNNEGETINVGITINENGIGTTISESELGTETVTQTTTITTSTTTNTSSSGFEDPYYQENTETIQHNAYYNMNNCLVDNNGLTKVVTMVKGESFSEDKLNVAKQFTKHKCLTVNQIKEIGALFSFSDDKMEYVKYAYDYCLNKQDYYEVNEIFTFSDDKNTLNGFLQSK